ncbi:hypothetical protein KIQ41_002007 [Salmonella enterica]|nr:hypothetical protein [Salmonella enterica]HEF8788524.1 hypothetical protein [Salmonella enterica subsp. enterica serovar Vinohrady]EHN1431697.1 hypothetical protein [Salmonella enterica]EHN1467523.1 hypothetical protein [Salmonella enterica]EHN1478565.1 hypothetical protein [Salmonella enterica]
MMDDDFWCMAQPWHKKSHHRTIIKLTSSRIIDDVSVHPKHWTVGIGHLILLTQQLPFAILQILQVMLWVDAIPFNAELASVNANQK